ncbi:MAG: hypothetical protein EPN97_05995 [Alphaproteobacteria bacterium]|nr:MAG: hypothetical protein EPN97_05995 [Alphaproteobacteria bacterium]
MQLHNSLNTALLGAVLALHFAKEPQMTAIQPFQIRPAVATPLGISDNGQRAQLAAMTGFNRSSGDYSKNAASIYDEREARLKTALSK